MTSGLDTWTVKTFLLHGAAVYLLCVVTYHVCGLCIFINMKIEDMMVGSSWSPGIQRAPWRRHRASVAVYFPRNGSPRGLVGLAEVQIGRAVANVS